MLQPAPAPHPDRLSWFAGNCDALDLYERLVFIAHAWDDLVDGDKPADVSALVANAMLHLPANPCFKAFEVELRGIFYGAITSYMAANLMEKSGDAHKIELAHFLRYAVMNAAIFLIGVLNGPERGAQILADAAPVLVPERLADYLKEHASC